MTGTPARHPSLALPCINALRQCMRCHRPQKAFSDKQLLLATVREGGASIRSRVQSAKVRLPASPGAAAVPAVDSKGV